LLLSRSWLGDEDPNLEPDLHRELSGILNWSLDGLDRLERQGRFTRPGSTEEAYITLQDLASPVGAFVRDRCELGLEHEVGVDNMWDAWKAWAGDNGHQPRTKQMLGRNLRAAYPRIRVARTRDGDERSRIYRGIALRGTVGQRSL
jgi:putative DNA primase/helicase